ncbi:MULTISPECIES: hypothetical protein [unclassified Amycolatopsis]|uniref:hypothetical protein n=1 Tax=unclassified Amycolatopsis TaxID=2618356 RepID=UPI00106E6C6F|nr:MULTISPECIES: hypothetical protein [unclassified Amycolatopsis]
MRGTLGESDSVRVPLTYTAFDSSGAVLWQQRADGHPYPPVVSLAGTVWIADRDADGYVLAELDFVGAVLRSVALEHE